MSQLQNNNMDTIKELAIAYRKFLIELGQEFKHVKEDKSYEGFADTFIDAVKSPEIGFTPSEVDLLIKMSDVFGLLEVDDLPSHHAMKLMVTKKVDMNLLEDAKLLSVTDFKEKIKDEESGTQERTYKYEIIKRVVETGNIRRVYGEELETAVKELGIK